MDTIKYLLKFLFKFAVVSFFAALVWWLAATFNPGFSARSLLYILTSPNAVATSSPSSWLPAPGSFKGVFASVKPVSGDSPSVGYGTVFHGYDNSANGGQFDYVTYKQQGVAMAEGKGKLPASGTQNTTGAVSQTNVSAYAQNGLYIRSLSVYEGGRVYPGLTFTGEARESMFSNGKFPVIIADKITGRVISVATAVATTNWSVPGWVRFGVTVNTILPNNSSSCLMIFEQGKTQASQSQPIRTAIPVTCN